MLYDKEIVELFLMTIKKEGSIHLPAQGSSMYPFIKNGEICSFNECDPIHLKKGDIVLFYTSSNRLIAHRYYKELKDGQRRQYLFKGDTNICFDEAIYREQMVGKLVYVQKRKYKLLVSGFLARTWAGLILAIPFLTGILRKCLNIQQRLKGSRSQ
ncbi:signal peptidase I [Bacillus sp. mrc49]|uniref:signal peptidase I n=1 Tax=Bacillus sp. mrc49 TaxID=2054913 RepID=UPI000C274D6D|nr:signal peptidase I [Bacillus sp. mrc49]PJN91806.1 signal peptidase I [Bacillus sp. mrc49]